MPVTRWDECAHSEGWVGHGSYNLLPVVLDRHWDGGKPRACAMSSFVTLPLRDSDASRDRKDMRALSLAGDGARNYRVHDRVVKSVTVWQR